MVDQVLDYFMKWKYLCWGKRFIFKVKGQGQKDTLHVT